MQISESTLSTITPLRKRYLGTLPEFQELFIELMLKDARFLVFQENGLSIGYAIISNENALIEFYITESHIPDSQLIFKTLMHDFKPSKIFCKSFDSLLLSNCVLMGLTYEVLGVLYRDYVSDTTINDIDLEMRQAEVADTEFILAQDSSIHELFDTEDQLKSFIRNEKVFLFEKNKQFAGCGMILRTHTHWEYCDLGIWVEPSIRKRGIGTQIILLLRKEALKNAMIPTCGCAIDNLASQKTIEKSGFVSKHNLISFQTGI